MIFLKIMSETIIQDFINLKTFAIIVSTNLKPNYQHETIILEYDFNDIINSRYSEFWSKHGGYRENLILFPEKDIHIVWIDPTNSENKQEITFYKYINDYVKSIELLKHKDEEKDELKEEKYYDPNHMYYRCYNFGTCVEDATTHINWNCKMNDILTDGFSIRKHKFMKKFGTVMKFEDLISKIQLILKNNVNGNKTKIEPPIQIIESTSNLEFKEKYEEIMKENKKYEKEINDLRKLNELSSQNIQTLKNKLNEIESIYQNKLKEERKTHKIDVDREKITTNRYIRQYKELNKKYLNDIEKYENEISNLKHYLNENVDSENFDFENEKPMKIEKRVITKYYINDALWLATIALLIINIGLIVNSHLNI